MYEAIRNVLSEGDFQVVEQFDMPAQAARFEQIPRYLFESQIGAYLENHLKNNNLWQHQAQALEALGRGV